MVLAAIIWAQALKKKTHKMIWVRNGGPLNTTYNVHRAYWASPLSFYKNKSNTGPVFLSFLGK